ncbi:KamA family radical SAM protein [Pleionea sp. CnH1-48]|uniref:KamA family radical SAM protein n=1 Tax=Pleionea sp. CnH1-48 TaxID=2954494 RepID=UPI0020975D3D|nr:lysine 2,3-aminomutase [Pleionea sp. CnH1-48]MCO7224382.1 lysine 2,3-aminomutase [Pleionea sp. CnH1-48]
MDAIVTPLSIQDDSLQQAGPPKLKVFTAKQLNKIPQFLSLPTEAQLSVRAAAEVFPFRVNQYVIDELIDWNNWQADPMFRLLFPQKEMLSNEHLFALEKATEAEDKKQIEETVKKIRASLNPHPAGQMELNVPRAEGEPLDGIQHKYKETVLFFPKQGQTCHSYCSFCFRWAQFIGDKSLQFAAKEALQLVDYLREHKEVTDVLITGGDPLVMKTKNLKAYVETIINAPGLEHIENIRIGTKALTFWPYRFVTDNDADELMELFESVIASGRQLALMAHYNHWKELDTDIAKQAIRRVRDTGAVIRSQGPLLRGINDDPEVWAKLWKEQTKLGITPYYMFVERDTGAQHYFEVPLVKAWEIYRQAISSVSGLSRTARGPSMSASPGKVEIQGVTTINNQKVLSLRFIQGRNPDWVQRPFYAEYDESATWLNHLKPAFGEKQFFFEAQ